MYIWSKDEDLYLKECATHLKNKWTQITSLMNEKFHGSKPIRSPRIIRERYKNYINPDISKDKNWSVEEDM